MILAVPADPAPGLSGDLAGSRALLLDIEGTTTPIDFVYGTLFPYARARAEDFLSRHHESDDVRADLEALRQQRAAEAQLIKDLPPWREDSSSARLASAAAYVQWLMDHDRKLTALKSLQGKIWEAGYRGGELRGAVYPDVGPAFARWRRMDKIIAIFSSGSVLAQKLLFANSTAGDLTPFISAYFDTTTGPKQEEQSYRRIAASLGLSPGAILFISDAIPELDAARRAGMATLQCLRPGTSKPSSRPGDLAHRTIRSFDEVFPETDSG